MCGGKWLFRLVSAHERARARSRARVCKLSRNYLPVDRQLALAHLSAHTSVQCV